MMHWENTDAERSLKNVDKKVIEFEILLLKNYKYRMKSQNRFGMSESF